MNSRQSNCILAYPDRIRLDYGNGFFTLKAGSRLIFPSGGTASVPEFEEVTTAEDKTSTYALNGDNILVFHLRSGEIKFYLSADRCFSGATPPTVASGGIWYDTENNQIKYTNDGGTTWTAQDVSLPSALIRGEAGNYTVYTTFNYFSFCGSSIVTYPGTTGAIPNGFENGEPACIHLTTSKFCRLTTGQQNAHLTLFINENSNIGTGITYNVFRAKSRGKASSSTANQHVFIEDENIWWYAQNAGTWTRTYKWLPFAAIVTNANAQITSLEYYKTAVQDLPSLQLNNEYWGQALKHQPDIVQIAGNGIFMHCARSDFPGSYYTIQNFIVSGGQYFRLRNCAESNTVNAWADIRLTTRTDETGKRYACLTLGTDTSETINLNVPVGFDPYALTTERYVEQAINHFAARKPVTGISLGGFQTVVGNKLPAGGTWAYWANAVKHAGSTDDNFLFGGIAAGGSTVTDTTRNWTVDSLICWRIS